MTKILFKMIAFAIGVATVLGIALIAAQGGSGFAVQSGGKLFGWVENTDNAFLGKGKPENGRCPVCGTQHEHYYREDWAANMNKSFQCAGSFSVNGTTLSDCRQAIPSQAPPDRIVRCKRCNTAFYQDVESKPIK